ncbi:PAS domain S-box protein [Mucilaginibacter sp. L3T2-6]|uniref:PAS domain S-box protein n=1 Tax=Mucilaginibacter sp. L3T2-6 TaxID=3062491 RepID=UPI00267528FE|nr:PAS domain S-box protein [Mucilaginibacter sp. L3T2-6]MDO3643771.1 PAS domain S-box protein [Mucilaginibacter sp. L3T2-6]MDV6216222.1 PAS domain S-box protein [Mucilaginibacter sp. L3T2-6]
MQDLPLNGLGFFFDDHPSPMWVYDIASLRILKVNNAAIRSYGYNEEEFLSLTIRDLRSKEDVKELENHLDENSVNQAATKGIVRSGMWKHRTKAGHAVYVEITSHDIQYKDTNCRIVVAADVTDKLRYQEEALLREQELIGTKNSLEALINNTEDQIWSVDKETRYVYMNQAYRSRVAHLTGVAPRPGDYSYLHSGYNEDSVNAWKGYYARALAGEAYSIVSESVAPDTGETLSFEVSFNPICTSKNEIIGVGCFARNITERLKTEKAIIEQNDRLRHIASLTSHELRRPVASLLGLIAIMDRVNFFNPDNREIIEHLLTVGNEIDEVIRLIVDKTFMGQGGNSWEKYQSP